MNTLCVFQTNNPTQHGNLITLIVNKSKSYINHSSKRPGWARAQTDTHIFGIMKLKTCENMKKLYKKEKEKEKENMKKFFKGKKTTM